MPLENRPDGEKPPREELKIVKRFPHLTPLEEKKTFSMTVKEYTTDVPTLSPTEVWFSDSPFGSQPCSLLFVLRKRIFALSFQKVSRF